MDAYQQQGRLGEGSHGQVLKAQHLPSGRVVALKQLPLHDYTRRLLELEQDAEALTAMAMSRQAGSRRQDGIAVDEQEDEHDEDQEDRGPATDRMKPQPFVINHHLQLHGMHPLSVFREIMALKRLRHENVCAGCRFPFPREHSHDRTPLTRTPRRLCNCTTL